jgi:hypothetical protein
VGKRLLRSALLSSVFFKLSIFQRHHAQKKVFTLPRSAPPDRVTPEVSQRPRREPRVVTACGGA